MFNKLGAKKIEPLVSEVSVKGLEMLAAAKECSVELKGLVDI